MPITEISILAEGRPPDPPAPKSSSVNPPQVTPLTEFVVNLTAAREETAKAGVGDKIKPKTPPITLATEGKNGFFRFEPEQRTRPMTREHATGETHWVLCAWAGRRHGSSS